MSKAKIGYGVYFLLVFLSIFNDSVFSTWFGYFGRSIMCVFLPFAIAIYLLIFRRFELDKFFKVLLILLLGLVIINVMSDMVFYFKTNQLYIGNENIFVKSVKGVTYWTYNIFFYLLVYSLGKKLNFSLRCQPFVFTFFFLFIVLVVELLTMPHAWTCFHYENSFLDTYGIGANVYYRVRLTTTESSLTVPLIIVFGSITLYYYKIKKKNNLFFISLILAFIFVITSSARTLLLFAAVFVTYLILKIITGKKKSKITLFLSLLVIVAIPIIAVSGINYLYEKIFTQSLGSLATRTTSLVAAVIHAFIYPLGLGNAVSGTTMQTVLTNVVAWFSRSKVGSSWNYWEIYTVFLVNPERLGPFGLFSYALYWGIVGTGFFYYGLVILYKRFMSCSERNKYIAAVFWGLIAIMTIAVPINNCFTFWAFLAFISLLSAKEEDIFK